jgi:hypothetical protein
MKLNEIITVSGYSGLFKKVAKGKNNLIVESLVDGKRMPVFATDKANSLANIALFTTGEEIPLSEVLQRIYKFQEQKEVKIDFKKNQKEMLLLFEKIIPEYDKTKVYASDIKKIFTWYNILLKHNLIDLAEEEKAEEGNNTQSEQHQNEQKVEKTEEESSIKETKPKRTSRKKKNTEE